MKTLPYDQPISVRVNASLEVMNKVVVASRGINGTPIRAQLLRLKKISAALLNLHKLTSGAPALRKKIECAYNECVSIREGLSLDEVTPEDIRDFTKSCMDLVSAHKAYLEKSQSNSSSHPLDEQLAASPSKEAELEEEYKNAENVLKRTKFEQKRLLDIRKKDFVVARAPVIPVSSPALIPETLKSAGFSVERIRYYAVLQKQLVIGLSSHYMAENRGKKPQDLLNPILEHLRRQIGQSVAVVSGSVKWDQGLWFWVMPQREYARLRSTVRGDSLKITNWGFAFATGDL